MNTNPGSLRLKDVQRRFDRCAGGFDSADFVHRAAFDGIIERLAPMTAKPKIILDLGSATGCGSRLLGKRFRGTRVFSLDASIKMLKNGKRQHSFFSKVAELQGDARRIPLQTGSVDLVFSNMLLPWIDDLPGCFGEIARVLRKGGIFVFSSLGPDSLAEIRGAWQMQDQDWHVNAFPDMHNIGDLLVRAGLADPVLDVDALTVTYRDTKALFQDLTNCGARNALALRRRTLTGKNRFAQMDSALHNQFDGGLLELKLELVFGHAWARGPAAKSGEIRLDPASIGRRQH